MTYSAKVVGRNDSLAPVLNDGLYHLMLTSLLGSLIDKTYVIEVTATLPLTSWQETRSLTVKTVLAGTLVSC